MIKTITKEIVSGILTNVMTTKYSNGKTVRKSLCPKTNIPVAILPSKPDAK